MKDNDLAMTFGKCDHVIAINTHCGKLLDYVGENNNIFGILCCDFLVSITVQTLEIANTHTCYVTFQKRNRHYLHITYLKLKTEWGAENKLNLTNKIP